MPKDHHLVCTRISWATAYILSLLFGLAGIWSFQFAVYTANTTGLSDMYHDKERLAFGLVGAVFTILVIMPIDPGLFIPKKYRNKNVFLSQKQVDEEDPGCCSKATGVVYSYFTFFFSLLAGSVNVFNASAMGTEKIAATPNTEARHFSPGVAALLYMTILLATHKDAREIASSLPVAPTLV